MKRVAIVLGALVFAATGALLAIGWVFAGRLGPRALRPNHAPDPLDLIVVDASADTVSLRAGPGTDRGQALQPGVHALVWPGGRGVAGEVIADDGTVVVRRFVARGHLPAAGEHARLDGWVYPDDPGSTGIGHRHVTIDTPLGDAPAWLVPGEAATWAIFVHGKGATRREALRVLPVFHELGLPGLVIAYRNDAEAPASPDGMYRYGAAEWEDLEAAARYALGHGAERLLLFGFSMGGSIVMSFLQRSELAREVHAVVLDAPCLSFEATIDASPAVQRLPWPLAMVGKQVARARYGIDWRHLDYLPGCASLGMPVLLMHGDGDQLVHIGTSEQLCADRPDIVSFHRFEGAGHVRSWNVDPPAYDAALREFLCRVLRVPEPAQPPPAADHLAYALSRWRGSAVER